MEIIRKLDENAIIRFIKNHDIRMVFLRDFRDAAVKILIFQAKNNKK